MMIVRGLHNLRRPRENLCLSLGNFDGLHLGHQKIIRCMMERASDIRGKGCIFTFNPHPKWVLRPDAPTYLLTTLREQAELLSRWGLDILILARFDEILAQMKPEEFVKSILVDKLMIKEIFVGEGFAFGHKKTGGVTFLKKLGERYGFRVNVIELMQVDGKVVSSTLIRDKVLSGEVEEANRLLGYEYSLTGRVIKGCGRGWRIGYPTANLKVISKLMPSDGVYLVRVKRGGSLFSGAANIGKKPTFQKDAEMGVEVYILELNENLYGERLTIYFQKWLREEIAFPNEQDLINQIRVDIEKVNQWIVNHPIN